MQRRQALSQTLLWIAAAATSSLSSPPLAGQQTTKQAHVEWVIQVLTRMQTIKSGDTRKRLLTVFTETGGLSTPLQKTYVSRDCPYFKVDAKFRIVGRAEREPDGRVTLIESGDDIITDLSPFYLGSGRAD